MGTANPKYKKCPHCGKKGLYPTWRHSVKAGKEVSMERCRYCGYQWH